MFYQEYRKNATLEEKVNTMLPNTAYYLDEPFEEDVEVQGKNGSYILVKGEQVIYNPLIEAKINNGAVEVHPIPNLIEGKVVSKIQVEFSEKNTYPLS